MADLGGFEAFGSWLEARLGVALDCARADCIPVVAPERAAAHPLWAVRFDERCLVVAQAGWVAALQFVVDGLTPDELFSVFGAYELSRVTLPEGYGIWGPSWFYVADERSFTGERDERTLRLSAAQMGAVDARVFWHCASGPEAVGFGIYEGDRLVALATVRPDEGAVWEIGMDVAPEVKTRGLGRAVFGAAGLWVLEQGRLVLGTTAPWNIPSARTMRSLGMRMVLSSLISLKAPMLIPPQPLGSPLPGAELRQYYPDWAMNRDILPREG
jgi:GNAT superfamily N-acetyltransferase